MDETLRLRAHARGPLPALEGEPEDGAARLAAIEG